MAIDANNVQTAVQTFVDYALGVNLIKQEDKIWLYNSVVEAVGACGPAPCKVWLESALDKPVPLDIESILNNLTDIAVDNECIQDTLFSRDQLAMDICAHLLPKPSDVHATFNALCKAEGVRAATDWFYQLCCDVNYVRRSAIARNIRWETKTQWGNLEITINLSKPEKDPRDIAAAVAPTSDAKYPACQLCIENEGYAGRAANNNGAHPARQNLRIIPLELGGERWGFQYSPYAYFNEHCIVMSAEHRPMHINHKAFSCLLDFIDTVSHYFIGSNADLPIVGGSILSHDHFQGGAHEFPMMRAAVAREFLLKEFPSVQGAVLVWPLSVFRLQSKNRNELLAACDHILAKWIDWDDTSVGVVSHGAKGERHNTITPVMRRLEMDGSQDTPLYEAYLALRCNVVSAEHPLGVFHPHAEWHHIKKENIGLIEVMGLAILPPRLKAELSAVENYLLDASDDADFDLEAALKMTP